MSRDYQPYKNNKYLLPRSLYKMTLAFIRDYDRRKQEYDAIGTESPPPPDGQPRGTVIGKPTERAGISRAELKADIDAVKSALDCVPPEYRKGVWDSIVHNKRYPNDAAPRTYSYHKQRFIYQVARNKLWI